MFDLAVLRRTGNGEELIDVGQLAETLLFYTRAHLILEGGTLAYLLKTLGPDLLLEVLEQPSVSASFLRSQPATTRTAAGGLVTYNFVEVEFHAPKSPNVPKSGIVKRASDAEWIELMVERSLGASRTTRRFTKKLIKKLSPATWKDNAVGSKSLTVLGREDLNDLDFVQQAVGRVVSTLVPSFVLPNDWHFRPMLIGDQIAIDTNFDFAALNQEYHKRIPASHSSLSPEYLLNHLLEARGTILMGSRYLGELVVDPATAAVVKLKCVELMRKRDAQVEELDLFQELNLPNAKKLRECINSGERSFADFLKLLEHSEKFKEWLSNRNPDARLLQEYYRAAFADSWINKLRTKTSRWVVATGLVAAVEAFYPTGVAIAAAQGVSLLDATLLERILKGWRPNQFVEARLADFVSGEDG